MHKEFEVISEHFQVLEICAIENGKKSHGLWE
jgi:hypothetical protein